VQPRTFIVSLEDGQLLAKCQIFQREVSLSTEQQNDESHYDDNCIQHQKPTVPPSDERFNGLGAQEFWRMTAANAVKSVLDACTVNV